MSLKISGSNPYNEIPNVEIKPVKTVSEETKRAAAVGSTPQGQDSTETQEDPLFKENRIKAAVERANEKLKITRTRCEFSYHEEIKRISFRIINEDTNEVIREIPTEQTVEAIEKMWELAGILVDERR